MSAFAAGAVCLSGWGALSLSGLSVGASGPCTPYDPTTLAAGVYKNINTTDGCDQAAGNALYPITGFVAGSGLTANAKYTVYDIYQTLPDAGAKVYYGAYTLGLVPTVGTATDGAYTVAAGDSTYPTLPAAPTGVLPTVTTDASGNFAAAYSLTVQNQPAVDHLASSRNDLWLVMDGNDAGHVATVSVKPPVLTVPTPTPTESSSTSSSSTSTGSSSTTTGSESSTSTTSTGTSSSTSTETSSSTSTETSSSTSTGSVSGSSTSSSESSSTSSVTQPSPTPAGSVLGSSSSSSSSSGGGIGGITTPNTGAGANSALSTALLGFGLSFLVAGGVLGRRRKS